MNLPIQFDGIPCCDQFCEICKRLFRGPGPREGKCLKRLHHNIDGLQASAKSGCHLCNLIIGVMDRKIMKELHEELTAASESYNRCLCVTVQLGDYPRLKILGSRFRNQMLESLLLNDLSLEMGEEYCLNHIFHIPTFNLDLHVLDSNPLPDRTIVHRTRSTNTLHNGSLSLVSKWSQDCRRCHPLCRRSLVLDQNHLPTRLLEISINDTRDFLVRLRRTEDLPQVPQYVTLSHRWKKDPVCLIQDNQSSYETAIPLNDLPKHFIDAIYLCWSLDYKYIWIDSLCIIQDSTDDWLHEAGRMGDVYANSSLTFAATAASDSACGLKCDRSYLEVAPCRIQASWENGERYNLVCYNTIGWQQYVESAELSGRAWVVQERLLSPRTIHFAADQVYWECTSLRASEFLPHGPIPHQPDYTADENLKSLLHRSRREMDGAVSFDDAWTKVLRLYTRTELTKESDRIVAMSGIVDTLSNIFDLNCTDFVMGLWKSRLPYQLLWYAEGIYNEGEVWDEAPSWSWVSYRGSVEYDDIFWSGAPLISVLEVNKTSLYLQGYLCAMADLLKFVEVDNRKLPARGDFQPWRRELFYFIQWNDSPSQHSEESFTETLVFCPVCVCLEAADVGEDRKDEEHVHGLVLKPTRKERGQYQRVGTINLGFLGQTRDGFRIPEDYSTKKLDASLFQEFDRKKGYTIEII
jgi:hypothetical protein